MYNVRIYKNTGFNAVNIPDTPALLNNFSYIDVNATDVVQQRFLSSIRVQAEWNDVQDADYCRIDDFYYMVDNVAMAAYNVAELSLVPDFITSAGGVNSFSILDGTTVRVHVANDGFGMYTEDDPYMNPAETLLLQAEGMKMSGLEEDSGSPGNYSVPSNTVIESTLDLCRQATTTLEASTYTGSSSGQTVEVPKTVPLGNTATDRTRYYMNTPSRLCTWAIYGSKCFKADEQDVLDGVQLVRDIGAESCIINQVALPKNFFPDANLGGGSLAGEITRIESEQLTESSGIPIDWAMDRLGYAVRNNRLLYGSLCKYKLMTASGDTAEFNPEYIASSASETPSVIGVADPRLDGRPYFRFSSYLGDGSAQGFWQNCIPGLQWKQVPLVWYQKSGNAMDAVRFQSEETIKYETGQTAFDVAQANLTNTEAQGILSLGKNLTSIITNPIGGIYSTAGGAISSSTQALTGYANLTLMKEKYALETARELYDYGVSQNVVVPTVQFPYNTETIRDFFGNGVFVYRYYMSYNDAVRVDKLLTMYGYRHTKQLETSDFNNRQYFNYVQAQGISIGGNRPHWWKAGIADQLSAGVRIWHTSPDTSYYTNNPIV